MTEHGCIPRDEALVREAVAARMARLGAAAERLDLLVAGRLRAGRAEYGPLDLGALDRDLVREALEEALDLAIYVAMRLLQLDAAGAGGETTHHEEDR